MTGSQLAEELRGAAVAAANGCEVFLCRQEREKSCKSLGTMARDSWFVLRVSSVETMCGSGPQSVKRRTACRMTGLLIRQARGRERFLSSFVPYARAFTRGRRPVGASR